MFNDQTSVETMLDARRLQIQGRNGRWYDVRRNGATKTWKRSLLRASIPAKVGLRECFRIEFNDVGVCYETLRERP